MNRYEFKIHKFFKNGLVNNCSLFIVYNDVLKNDYHRQNFEEIYTYIK